MSPSLGLGRNHITLGSSLPDRSQYREAFPSDLGAGARVQGSSQRGGGCPGRLGEIRPDEAGMGEIRPDRARSGWPGRIAPR